MARGKSVAPWHSAVIQLDSEGKSVPEIMQTLLTMDEPPTAAAVRKFLERSHKDPNFALRKLTGAPAITNGLTIERDKADVLADAMTAVELEKADLSLIIIAHMKKVLTARTEPDEWELKKFALATEAMKSIKGNVFNVTATQNNQTNNITILDDERRKAIGERIAQLATIDA